ncbi:unnamed protein product [Adineta ricciae]|uniref:Fatty acyl-CoA reductase n=1 Tax=Adineta ricciae TaxID=249248 RepID=A0A814UPY3_ADIRI|nr:unnamed protein product [Adineta ricciae]
MADANKDNGISEFFYGKSLFLTGGTGFVGKQIIEKLLRSCSDINHIYILIRSKRNKNINDRINHLCSLPLFDKIRSLNPNFQSKLIPIIGDLTKVNFDLSCEDEQLIINNCHMIIHSGASIRFNEPFKEAIKSNVLSVQSIINLCRKMKQLQSCVHISTAYVHCYRTDIEEIIYPTNENPQLILEALENLDGKLFDHLALKSAKNYPNIYTYTKSLSEYLIFQQTKDLPFAIIRPSIIGATWKEPIPGWIDNYSGTTSILTSLGKCLLRSGQANSHIDHPLIPVDIVANMTIAIGWITATKNNLLSNPMVYNCSTGSNYKTCVSFSDYVEIVIREQKSIGFENYRIIQPNLYLTTTTPFYYIRRFFEEILPAYLIDFFCLLTFRKTGMVKLNKKISNAVATLNYFASNQWIFSNHNSQFLLNQMTDFDKQEFHFDVKDINWTLYLRNYCIGVKKYLLKEPLYQSKKSKLTLTKTM